MKNGPRAPSTRYSSTSSTKRCGVGLAIMETIMASPGNAIDKFDLDAACEILERTPAALNALLSDLPDDLTTGGQQDEWAPFDIVGHLIHGELTDWIPRGEIILGQGEDRT